MPKNRLLHFLSKGTSPAGGAGDMRHTPTIALLPGLLCDASIWSVQCAELGQVAPVVIPDFSQLSSLSEMASSVLKHTAGPLVVVGHSMGARVALEVVRLAPERVVGLALIDTGIHLRKDGEEAKRQALVKLAYAEGMAALADVWLPPMVDPRRKDDRDLIDSLKAMVTRATPDQHQRQIQALLNRPDARGVLASVSCPTLVMVGRQDQWSPIAQHEEIASLIPGSRLVIIEDCGHMSLAERPMETTQALLDWLLSTVLPQVCPVRENLDDAPAVEEDRIPDTPLLDRKSSLRGASRSTLEKAIAQIDRITNSARPRLISSLIPVDRIKVIGWLGSRSPRHCHSPSSLFRLFARSRLFQMPRRERRISF